jgi:hypothetical protein
MHNAALPLRVRKQLRGSLYEAQARVRDDQLHASQAALLQVAQEPAPAFQVLFLAFGHSENLPVTISADADRHQHGDVPHFAGPAALQNHAVQKQVRELAFDRPVAPGLDVGVDLLVQPRHRSRTDPGSPQRLGDVFHPPHAHSCQVHLDQRFLDR